MSDTVISAVIGLKDTVKNHNLDYSMATRSLLYWLKSGYFILPGNYLTEILFCVLLPLTCSNGLLAVAITRIS